MHKKKKKKKKKKGSKPIINYVSQIIQGWRDTTESQLERFDGCCIPDVKWQRAPDRRPKRETAHSPPVLHHQGGNGRKRMPVQEWSDREGRYSCRRSERRAWVEEVTALKQRHANTGNSSVGGQPVELTEYRWDVYSYRGAQTTSWAAVLGLSERYILEMRKTGQGAKSQILNYDENIPVTLE